MEKIFLDTNSLIHFLTNHKIKADKVESIISNTNNEIYTSYLVLNEVKFILLISKAMQITKTGKKWELIKFIKNNKPLRKEVMEKYISFYVNIKSKFKILGIDEDAELLSCNASINYGLLPTDASIVANMIEHKIKKILTDDSDFRRVGKIEVIQI